MGGASTDLSAKHHRWMCTIYKPASVKIFFMTLDALPFKHIDCWAQLWHNAHHARKTALHFRVWPITVVIAMVPRGASGGVWGAVWTGRHIGADLGELGCDELEKREKKHSLTNISCSKVLLNIRQKLWVWNALLSKLRKNSQLDAYSFIFEV